MTMKRFTKFVILLSTTIVSLFLGACASKESSISPFWKDGDGLNSSNLDGLAPSLNNNTDPNFKLEDSDNLLNLTNSDKPGNWGADAPDYIDGFGAKIPGVEFEPVYFHYDQNTITDSEIHKIETVAKYLLDHPKAAIVIEGYCDERGTDEYNRALGERRALAAKLLLSDYGIEDNRIKTVTYGEERPVDSGHLEASWAKNRRDEFIAVYMKN